MPVGYFRNIREFELLAEAEILLAVENLKKYFPVHKGLTGKIIGYVRAVDDISFVIRKGETLGLVGESGCGKTTTGRTILRLTEPTAGKITYYRQKKDTSNLSNEVIDLVSASNKLLKSLRKDLQVIFQDPYSSLNPRMTVRDIISEPLKVHRIAKGRELEDRVQEILESVGLKSDHLGRYPYEFSGGQRQRIGIARALVLNPKLIIADEPVSALDVSIQAQIINLLDDLQKKFDLTYLFIAHDLSVIKHLSVRVGVMYLGKLVELAETQELFSHPKHPYTEALMSAVPIADPYCKAKRIILYGDVPNPINPPAGCRFHPRCRYIEQLCRIEIPSYQCIQKDHWVSCHFAEKLDLKPMPSSRSTSSIN